MRQRDGKRGLCPRFLQYLLQNYTESIMTTWEISAILTSNYKNGASPGKEITMIAIRNNPHMDQMQALFVKAEQGLPLAYSYGITGCGNLV